MLTACQSVTHHLALNSPGPDPGVVPGQPGVIGTAQLLPHVATNLRLVTRNKIPKNRLLTVYFSCQNIDIDFALYQMQMARIMRSNG